MDSRSPAGGDHLDDVRMQWLAKGLASVGGAIGGAVLGAIFLALVVNIVAGMLNWPIGLGQLRLYCGLAGAVLGAGSGYAKAVKEIRRRLRTREVAHSLGLEYASDAEDELESNLREMLSVSGSMSLDNVAHRQIDAARFLVGDMSYQQGGSKSNSGRTVHQTIAYFESDALQWPAFALQPEGMMLNLLSSVTGIQDIDFDEFPEFSRSYHLSSVQPARAQQLFGPELLEYFTRHRGLQVKAEGHRLVLFRPGRQCDPDQLKGFIDQALEIFSLFMEASDRVGAAEGPAAAGGSAPAVSERAAPPVVGGLVGAVIGSLLVTAEEVDAFLAQPTPRTVPARIRRQRVGSGSAVTAVMGGVFALVGIGMGLAALTGQVEGEDRTVMLLLGGIFPPVGLAMLFFAVRFRHRNMRLLRHGVATTGRIEKVEDTGVSINNQQQYRLNVRFQGFGGEQQGNCYVYGRASRAARQYAESGTPVRLLYDPAQPSRILWADALSTAVQAG